MSRASQTCWLTCPVSMLAMQELGCFQLPGIVYRSLQHGAVHYHAATWGDGRGSTAKQWPQDIVKVSLCLQNAINITHLCSLSITYACPYHIPATTMGHSIHNVDISKPLTHTTQHTLSTICPKQWKPGFIREENASPTCQTLSNVSIAHSSRLRWRTAIRSRPRWGWQACRWASLRWFLTVCAEILWLCKPIVEVLGWYGYTWSVVVRLVGFTAKLSETPLEMAYSRQLNTQFTGTALVDIPAVSMPIAHSCDICGIVPCDKTEHFIVAFYCGQLLHGQHTHQSCQPLSMFGMLWIRARPLKSFKPDTDTSIWWFKNLIIRYIGDIYVKKKN